MKIKLKIILFFLIMTVLTSGCMTVKPWERGQLSKPTMIMDKNTIEKGILEHHIERREGSSGATGSQSGGCGCG
jgi:hypothetical protein